MEFIQGTHKVAKKDVISNMPDNVITNILDRLPIRDAVKTDVLSKNWRFKWTFLSQLVFDDDFFAHLSKTKDRNNHVRIISRLLLHLRSDIAKFVLSIDDHGYSVLNAEDISHWILFLSRKGIKDLTIEKKQFPLLKLPTYLFSCLGLKHLKLSYCIFPLPSIFHGFSNMLSLELEMSHFESLKFRKFITGCPALESLKVIAFGNLKLDEIAKLANLKTLSLLWYNLEKMPTSFSSSTIIELLGFVPKLQEFELDFRQCKFKEDGAKKSFATVFPCLKTLKLSRIDLDNGVMLSYAFRMIKSFPNLQTLEIIADSDSEEEQTPSICSPEEDNNTVRLLQLRSVVFTYCKGSENEVCLVRYLLACSPFLQKIVILPCSSLIYKKKFMFAKKLLKLHRASSVVDIDLS